MMTYRQQSNARGRQRYPVLSDRQIDAIVADAMAFHARSRCAKDQRPQVPGEASAKDDAISVVRGGHYWPLFSSVSRWVVSVARDVVFCSTYVLRHAFASWKLAAVTAFVIPWALVIYHTTRQSRIVGPHTSQLHANRAPSTNVQLSAAADERARTHLAANDLQAPVKREGYKEMLLQAKAFAETRAAGEVRRGNALREQAKQSSGPEAVALLAEAVQAYRAALELRSRQESPQDWALTQDELGAALREANAKITGGGSVTIRGASGSGEAVPEYQADSGMRLHQIIPGDRYWHLKDQYNVDLQALIDANPGRNPRKLMPGSFINIPVGNASVAQSRGATGRGS